MSPNDLIVGEVYIFQSLHRQTASVWDGDKFIYNGPNGPSYGQYIMISGNGHAWCFCDDDVERWFSPTE